ncbi:MAG TPA: NADH-quinone oxidoreductase subunit C [Vicinamibacterales bacterium]|jgi:NADH-quinone oxidoreductase subunit C|nr:NADH-quinone oxidoreductase subunit C [Vicinamibacterales bacterium]
MDATTLIATLQQEMPGAQFEPVPAVDRHVTIYTAREHLVATARALRDRADLRFTFLAEITAVDTHPAEPRFELIYLLASIEHKVRLRLKVRLAGEDAHVATLTSLWPAANWLEREVWDMFGIQFDGHPDPRRLLMPEDWDGFPLRKDYPVQIRKVPLTAQALQVTEQDFKDNIMKDRLNR